MPLLRTGYKKTCLRHLSHYLLYCVAQGEASSHAHKAALRQSPRAKELKAAESHLSELRIRSSQVSLEKAATLANILTEALGETPKKTHLAKLLLKS